MDILFLRSKSCCSFRHNGEIVRGKYFESDSHGEISQLSGSGSQPNFNFRRKYSRTSRPDKFRTSRLNTKKKQVASSNAADLKLFGEFS